MMKIINLLPKEAQKEIRIQFLVRSVVIFWSAVVMSLVLFLALTFAVKIYLNKTIAQTDSDIQANQNLLDSQEYKKLREQVTELNNNIHEIKNLQDQHLYFSVAVSELAKIIPGEVQLNLLTYERATGKIEITGQAKDRESIIAIWASIIKSDYFKNVNFPLPNLEKAKIAPFTYIFYVNTDKINKP